MLRILHVVTDMNRGGLETMLMNYYRAIDKNKIQFDFLTHRSYKADYDDEIKEMGGIIYHLPRLNPISRQYKKALNNFFDKHTEYQIIHVHQDCMSSIVLKAAKKYGVKVRIAHSHTSSQTMDVKYPIKLFYKRFISRYATQLMACSKEAGEWMFQGAKFVVLNNAIKTSDYTYNENKRDKIRKELNIAVDELVIGHVGRFSPPKNHLFLLDVFYEIQKDVKAKLVLVGDGCLRSEIVNKIERLGIEDKVLLMGVRKDVDCLLQGMDVFVFPSIYEGLPVTLIEAQASGIPCIISDKVPIECKKTSLVKQVKLKEDIKIWRDMTIEASKVRRIDTSKDIVNAGYDIETNAVLLTNYYYEVGRRKNGEERTKSI